MSKWPKHSKAPFVLCSTTVRFDVYFFSKNWHQATERRGFAKHHHWRKNSGSHSLQRNGKLETSRVFSPKKTKPHRVGGLPWSCLHFYPRSALGVWTDRKRVVWVVWFFEELGQVFWGITQGMPFSFGIYWTLWSNTKCPSPAWPVENCVIYIYSFTKRDRWTGSMDVLQILTPHSPHINSFYILHFTYD